MRTCLVVLALVVAVVACGSTPAPALRVDAATPDDLRALAEETFADVLAAFPGRRDCLGGVSLAGAWELDDRARYDPGGREVTVRIPATAPQLRTSIVHELGHHLESACPAQRAVRDDFLTAQGFPPGTPWRTGETWEETPAEQWASAVVVHVLDRADTRARIRVEPEALDVVRAWAGGG